MLDIAVILGFLVLCTIVGVSRTQIKSFYDFANLPPKMKTSFYLFATIFATAVGSGSTLGLSQKLYNGNYEYLVAYILSLIWLFIIAKYFVPRITKFDGYTIGDIFCTGYGRVGQAMVGAFSVMFSIGHFSAQVTGCGLLFESFLGMDPIIGILISYSIIIFYSTIGGLRAVIKTDVLQLIIMFAGLILLFFIIFSFPSNDNRSSLSAAKISIDSSKFVINATSLTITFMVMTFYPHFIQRLLLTKDTRVLSKSLMHSIYAYLLFIFIIAFVSIKSQTLFKNIDNGQNLFHVICDILPQGFKGLVVASLIAALMSTADSDLNTAVVCLCRDLLREKDYSEQRMLFIARGFTCILGVAFVYFAVKFHNLLDLLIFLSNFWSPVILVPFIGLLYGKVITLRRLIFSTLLSVSSSYLWDAFYHGGYRIPGVLIGCSVSLITFWTFYKLNPTQENSEDSKDSFEYSEAIK
jgi:Na+/proline symporter